VTTELEHTERLLRATQRVYEAHSAWCASTPADDAREQYEAAALEWDEAVGEFQARFVSILHK
jgi:hypothetical protein